ncbi:MAG: L,D-transpeptidase family protein [Clostridia bacterium]
MKHFGKNRFISFFALLLVLTLALSMNSVFAADTAATGTDSTVQQESGEPPASKESNSAVSEQNPEQQQEQKPEDSASPENPTTPENPKNLGWVSDNNETRYYDTENHFVTGMNTIKGKKYYFNNDGVLQRGILKIGKAYYYADGKGAIRTAKGFVSCSGRLYYVQNGGQILAGKTFKLGKKTYRAAGNGVIMRGVYKWGKYYYYSDSKGVLRTAKGHFRWKSNTYYCNKGGKLTTKKMVKSGKYYYYFDSAAKAKTKAFKYHDVTIRPNKKTGAITKKQYRRASYGPYNYKKYILVDISNQTLKYYVKGKVKLKSNVVTGGRGCGTPTGRFKLHHKARNVNLTGPGYVSHVNYWMPFIGQSYGMHDASWRSQFGGSIYKYNGSHGCVNMPRSKVSKLYKMVPNGTRVIIRK